MKNTKTRPVSAKLAVPVFIAGDIVSPRGSLLHYDDVLILSPEDITLYEMYNNVLALSKRDDGAQYMFRGLHLESGEIRRYAKDSMRLVCRGKVQRKAYLAKAGTYVRLRMSR